MKVLLTFLFALALYSTNAQRISPDTIAILSAMGHKIAPYETTNPVVARVEAILNDKGWLQGGADGRGEAKAEGY